MWSTMFSFRRWHSAAEMRRYFKRFLEHPPAADQIAAARQDRSVQASAGRREMFENTDAGAGDAGVSDQESGGGQSRDASAYDDVGTIDLQLGHVR